MKKRILSVLLCGSFLFGTVFVNATSIEFEDLEQSNKTINIETNPITETVNEDISISIEGTEKEEIIHNELYQNDDVIPFKATESQKNEDISYLTMDITDIATIEQSNVSQILKEQVLTSVSTR